MYDILLDLVGMIFYKNFILDLGNWTEGYELTDTRVKRDYATWGHRGAYEVTLTSKAVICWTASSLTFHRR